LETFFLVAEKRSMRTHFYQDLFPRPERTVVSPTRNDEPIPRESAAARRRGRSI
jgi:hypothetical protein